MRRVTAIGPHGIPCATRCAAPLQRPRARWTAARESAAPEKAAHEAAAREAAARGRGVVSTTTHAPACIAITGLRSFVGQRLAERLTARGRGLRVIGIDLRRPWRLERRVPFERVDLTDPAANAKLAEIFVRERVEAVVHTAFRRDPTPDHEADHEL